MTVKFLSIFVTSMKSKKLVFIIIFLIVIGLVAVAVISGQKNQEEGLGSDNEIEIAPEAQASKTIELKDGDTFNLAAGFVKKKIGDTAYRMLAYNGSIPGPLIKLKQGSAVTINFKNETDVDSTIHSHGVRVENAFDGVPDLTQKPVKPGETFAYKLKFPDAGIYWYHPHIREDYAQELGLYGNFLVEPNDPNYWSRTVNREEVLMLDDILIENGKVARFDPENADHTLMGRYGNVMLVNGETGFRLEVGASEIIRFYFTNAANTRTFNLSIPNVRMKLVGGDNGKYEREIWADNIVVSPSERAVVEVFFEQPGAYQLQHQTPKRTYPMASIVAAVKPGGLDPGLPSRIALLRTNNDTIASIEPLRKDFDKFPDKSLRLAVAMKEIPMAGSGQHTMHGGQMMQNSMMRMGTPQPIEWEDDMGMMNRNSTNDTLVWEMIDTATSKVNMKINDWKFKVGDVVKIKIFNDPKSMHPMQHPIHIHGQRFLVLTTNGVPNNNFVWKDTALIKTGDTAEFLVEMSNLGDWMIHCHIAEHLEAGMMMKFEVI